MRLKVWTMRLKVVSMIFVTKFNSNPTVQIVSSVNSFIGGKCSSVFTLLITVNSKVLPVDNVSIGSRCIGVDIPVFFLTSLDRVAWTINLRGSLLSQRHTVSFLVNHVWGNRTETWGAEVSESAVTGKLKTSGTRDELIKWERKWQSFNFSFSIYEMTPGRDGNERISRFDVCLFLVQEKSVCD